MLDSYTRQYKMRAVVGLVCRGFQDLANKRMENMCMHGCHQFEFYWFWFVFESGQAAKRGGGGKGRSIFSNHEHYCLHR